MKRLQKTLTIGVAVTAISVFAACGDGEAPEENNGADTENGEQIDQDAEEDEDEDADEDAAADTDSSETIATVNGEEVTRGHLDQQMEQVEEMLMQQGMDPEEEEFQEMMQMQEEMYVDELVTERILLQEADNQGISADEDEVEEQYAQIRGQFEEDEEFEQALEASGFTEEDLMEDIRKNSVVSQLLELDHLEEDAIEVSDEEVEQMYEMQQMQNPEMGEFDDVRDEIEKNVKQQKYVEQLREESDIEIHV
ncbi:SurA N-terminal domain-containing protein [Alteribacter natronophilus]|uniref:SurA N-terminal domain-containing protein n=1 Tax=Alteribacter natronophilus TaxID=2583810 RepID=UPI0014869B1E|nr:SurA N-terminal domain-containing protein [Alteribacter natronophilus]